MGKKPTGEKPTARLSSGPGPNLQIQKLSFPDRKEDVEALVICNFDRSLDRFTRDRFGITEITQNMNQDDLDCTICGVQRNWLMDLAEYVPADLSRGGYAAASGRRNTGEMADRMIDVIRAKAAKYAALNNPWLLLYTTAWQFMPSSGVRLIVSDALMRDPPKLGRVMLISLFDVDRGAVETLHPVALEAAFEILRTDIDTLRNWETMNFHPSEGEITATAEGVSFRLPVQLSIRDGVLPKS